MDIYLIANMQFAPALNVCSKCATIRHLRPPAVNNGNITVAPSGAVNYQIVGTNTPTSYGSGTLPTGLSLNTSTGVISGNVPATLTTYTIPISATNLAGTGNGVLTLKVVSPVIVTLTLSSNHNIDSLQISIDGSPYAPATYGTPYSATFQIKTKLSVSGNIVAGSSAQIFHAVTNSALRILTSGSEINTNAIVTSYGGLFNSEMVMDMSNALPSFKGLSFSSTGTFNNVQPITSSGSINGFNVFVIVGSNFGDSATLSSGSFIETILNF